MIYIPPPERNIMQDLIDALKALSDETRLRIIHVLSKRECCVCEIMQALDISQTRASRNLGILHKNGFLKTSREGTWIIYAINRETANQHAGSLTNLLGRTSFKSEVYRKDIERLTKAKRIGYGCKVKKES